MSNQAAQELQSFVRRVENVEDEINVLNQDKSAIYKEAKDGGFNVKILRKVIAARRMDSTKREEQDAEFELYWNAVHGIDPDLVRAHVETIEEFDAETGEIIEPQVAPQPASDLTEVPPAPGGQVADIQPAMATSGEAHSVGAAVGESPAIREAEDIGSQPHGGSNVVATSAPIVAGEGAHNASVTLLIQKPLRPNCQRPERCGGQGKQHCYSCRVAAEQAGAA